MSKQREEIISQQFMKQFDRLISDVNVQLKILEAKINVIPKSHSSQATVAYNNTSSMGKFSMLKVVDENPSSDASSSTIDLSSIRQDVSTQLAEIDMELMRLEQNVIKTEMRIQEDVEAEEIGIEFPIARIIDYMTAIKLAMHKQQMLTKELHRIVLNNENFEKEAQLLMRDFVIWTKEKREDAHEFSTSKIYLGSRKELLTKLAQLEESLNKLTQFLLVYCDEFNKYYPLMADLSLLKCLVSQFLDKYEINISTSSTGKLTPSFSSLQPRQKETDSEDLINVAKSMVFRGSQNSLKKQASKSLAKHEVSSKEKKNQKYESQTDIHTAVEKI